MPSTGGTASLATLGLFLLVSASTPPCAARRSTVEASQDGNGPMVVTLEDDASHLTLHVDETVVVKLDCLPGAGYSWQVADGAADLLEAVGSPFFEPEPAADRGEDSVGTEEVQVFHFRGRKAGSGALELHYGRVWEEEAEPTRTFRVTVEVKEPPDGR